MILTFDAAEVEALFAHSKKSKRHPTLYDAPTGVGLLLVGDQGVYLMSSGPRVGSAKKPQRQPVAYADQVHPEKCEFDTWWQNKRASFGGDDGVEFLNREFVEQLLEPERRRRNNRVAIDITPNQITIPSPRSAR